MSVAIRLLCLSSLALSACAGDPSLGARDELRFTYGPDAQPVPAFSITQPVTAISVTDKDPEQSDNDYLPPDYRAVDLRDYQVQSSNPEVASFVVNADLDVIETTLHERGTTSLVVATSAGVEVDHIVIIVR